MRQTGADIPSVGCPCAAIVTEGKGKLICDAGEAEAAKGDDFFIPADVPGLRIEGKCTLILCRPEGAEYNY